MHRITPTLVETMAYKNVRSIACGAHHTAACVIRAWVHDQEAKSCMACKIGFTTVRRKVCNPSLNILTISLDRAKYGNLLLFLL